ncbi:MAG: alpha-L-fucosidase [Bryobacterales bacterium]|nr:alpha-L-fucosidase [Bryobacterales bacterium]
MNRRNFLRISAGASAAALSPAAEETGAQRLPLTALRAWESLRYGMFLHFGMSTYDGDELSAGDKPSTLYDPTRLDVDQWISVARDAGMKYAVLTTKHVAGHCLWPTRLNDYHVGTSSNKTDVVAAFVKACERRGILPGFYYCSWDNHNRFGSFTPSDVRAMRSAGQPKGATVPAAYVTRAYEDFQIAQLKELLTGYGKIGEVWIDIPMVLGRDYRRRLYQQIAEWQPQTIIMMNHGIGDGSELNTANVWPTDILAIERFLPNSATGHQPWRTVEGKRHYIPGEVCDPIGKEWFFVEKDRPRSDAELLGMYLVGRSRGTNLLLNVPPDRAGVIPEMHVSALMRLKRNLDKLGMW